MVDKEEIDQLEDYNNSEPEDQAYHENKNEGNVIKSLPYFYSPSNNSSSHSLKTFSLETTSHYIPVDSTTSSSSLKSVAPSLMPGSSIPQKVKFSNDPPNPHPFHPQSKMNVFQMPFWAMMCSVRPSQAWERRPSL